MKLTSTTWTFGMTVVSLAAMASVHAAPWGVPISDLYNTGVASPDHAVPAPLSRTNSSTAADPQRTISDAPVGPTPYARFGTKTLVDETAPFAASQFPRSQQDLRVDADKAYLNVEDSQRIKSLASALWADRPHNYVYEMTFLTMKPLITISISGFFKATDVIGFQLDSGPVLGPLSPQGAANQHLPVAPPSAFTMTGAGGYTSTIPILVNRPGTSTVSSDGTFPDASFTVPEQSTVVLGTLGLVGFGAIWLCRRLLTAAKAG